VSLTAACAIGPDYQRPETSAPAEYRGELEPAEAESYADLAWWQIFDDEVLRSLIHEALNANYDLEVAIHRVDQARTGVGVARSSFYPGLTAEGSFTRQRTPEQFGDPASTFNTFFGGLAVAWEIDVWGRIRRLSEAAEARYLGTEEARRGILLTLATTVAQSYLTLLELDRELEIAQETVVSFEKTAELFQQQFEGGIGTRLATARANAALASVEASVPEIERLITIQENVISVLLGRNPGPIPRGTPLVERRAAPIVPAGLPSDLLERRPDILQAEKQMQNANALIGVAKADFFPRIGLTALYGGQSENLGDIANGSYNVWNLVGSAVGPLFQGFRLAEQFKGSKAFYEETVASYEGTIVSAFAEVSNALITREKLSSVRALQEKAVAAYRESVELSLMRYDAGLAGYYEVLDAQQQLFPAELDLTRTQLSQLLAVVDLYRVLGGGWQLDDKEWVTGAFRPEEQDESAGAGEVEGAD
jgi:multidrug efflux system outer membrane protein